MCKERRCTGNSTYQAYREYPCIQVMLQSLSEAAIVLASHNLDPVVSEVASSATWLSLGIRLVRHRAGGSNKNRNRKVIVLECLLEIVFLLRHLLFSACGGAKPPRTTSPQASYLHFCFPPPFHFSSGHGSIGQHNGVRNCKQELI